MLVFYSMTPLKRCSQSCGRAPFTPRNPRQTSSFKRAPPLAKNNARCNQTAIKSRCRYAFLTIQIMKALFIRTLILLMSLYTADAQQPKPEKKPPIGIPSDAKLFNGKWYRIYFEKVTWKRARDKCVELNGQLACAPDAPTQSFLIGFTKPVDLWIGATDEKVEGLWIGVDGTEVKFKGWGGPQPNGGRNENFMGLDGKNGYWFDAPNNWGCVGFICEWKDK